MYASAANFAQETIIVADEINTNGRESQHFRAIGVITFTISLSAEVLPT